MNFISIDFETANPNYNSACQIGIVEISNGKIKETFKSYIKPSNMDFSPYNIKIHKITPDLVENAPTFNELWPKISKYFNSEKNIIAHNAKFDMAVLKACLNEYEIKIPIFNYMCSMEIAKVLNVECNYNLKDLSTYFNYEFNHHDALDDAKACAHIIISLLDSCDICSKDLMKKIRDEFALHSSYDIKIPEVSTNRKNWNDISTKTWNRVKISEIEAEPGMYDENHILCNKSIVFTGDLKSITREQAMQSVKNIGGIPRTSVSRNTDYLVVGVQDPRIVGFDGMSSKERKAYQLIEDGHDIKVLHEEDFLELFKEEKYE